MTKLESSLTMASSHFPPFMFICSSCGSTEVMIEWIGNEEPLRCRCLDCKEEWIEGKGTTFYFTLTKNVSVHEK